MPCRVSRRRRWESCQRCTVAAPTAMACLPPMRVVLLATADCWKTDTRAPRAAEASSKPERVPPTAGRSVRVW
ncbi:hypothetical protein [Delftia sp.]|uniref:hypothetical protein n=1 Tax=Delftia sp. TaxID=1886637 RepID=UPI00259CB66C|nr:hypothetical protein [Delftia sp.]